MHLFLGQLDLLERRGDLLEGQVAALPAVGDQRAKLVGVLKPRIAVEPGARLLAARRLFPGGLGAVVAGQQNVPLRQTPSRPVLSTALGVRAGRSIWAGLTVRCTLTLANQPVTRPLRSGSGRHRTTPSGERFPHRDERDERGSVPQRRRTGVAAPHRGQPDPRRRPRDREGDQGQRPGAVTRPTAASSAPAAGSRDAAGDYFFAELECFVDLNPRQAGVHMSRFEEVVNAAIDEVVLGETLRAEELAAHIAGRVREQQAGPARRGDDRRSLSGDGRDPGLGPSHSGDLHVVWNGGRLRARHPYPDRRRGPGDDRLPLRPGAGQRPLSRAAGRRRLHRRRDRACARGRSGGHPQPARHRVAAPRPAGGGRARTWMPATSCTSSSSR